MWVDIKALFAYLFGRKAGQEAERAAEQVATQKKVAEINHARETAPTTVAGLRERLRSDPNA